MFHLLSCRIVLLDYNRCSYVRSTCVTYKTNIHYVLVVCNVVYTFAFLSEGAKHCWNDKGKADDCGDNGADCYKIICITSEKGCGVVVVVVIAIVATTEFQKRSSCKAATSQASVQGKRRSAPR